MSEEVTPWTISYRHSVPQQGEVTLQAYDNEGSALAEAKKELTNGFINTLRLVVKTEEKEPWNHKI